jgi:hypothetical protein
MAPDHVRDMQKFIDANRRATTPFDIVVEGKTSGADLEEASQVIKSWTDAGATWWIEAMWDALDQSDRLTPVLTRIKQGPPRT